jgi:WD40 repeat protein
MIRFSAFLSVLLCCPVLTYGQNKAGSYLDQKHFTCRGTALSAAAFLGDNALATGSLTPDSRGGVQLWNIKTGQATGILPGQTGGVYALAVSRDTRILASGGDGLVVLYDIARSTELSRVVLPPGRVLTLCFAPQGPLLFAAGEDKQIHFLDVGTAKLTASIKAHDEAITSLAIALDGKTLYSGSFDASVKIWDVAARKLTEKLIANGGRVHGVAVSGDGKLLAAACAGAIEGESKQSEVALWSLDNTRRRKSLRDGGAAYTCVQFSNDGSLVSASRADGWIITWSTDEILRFRLQAHRSWITSIHYSKDGNSLATAGWESEAKLWDLPRWKPPVTVPGEFTGPAALAFDPRANLLMVGGMDKIIHIVDPTGKLPERQLQAKTDTTLALAVSADGRSLASGAGPQDGNLQPGRFNRFGVPQAPPASKQELITLWEIESGKESKTFAGHQGAVHVLAFSPNSQLLASGSADKTIRIWNLAQGAEQMQLIGHACPIVGLAFHPSGKILASASDDGSVRIWDLRLGQEMRAFQAQPELTGLAYSPDGRALATCSSRERTVTTALWDLATGENRWLVSTRGSRCTGVAFSPNGRQVFAVGGFDWEPGAVSIVDATTGKRRIDLLGGKSRLAALCLSADGKSLFACGQSSEDKGELWHWNLPNLDNP